MIKIKVAVDFSEICMAEELVCRVFGPNYFLAKQRGGLRLKLDPGFSDPRSWILAWDAGKLVGVVRVAEKMLRVADQGFSVGGITAVCVHPEYRGRKVAARLMKKALVEMRAKRFALSVLFGRRAVDGFYSKFGYHSVGAYPVLEISPRDIRDSRPTLVAAKSANLPKYIRAYNAVNSALPIRLGRSDFDWKIIFERAQSLNDYQFFEIQLNGRCIGYQISNSEAILEVGVYSGLEKRLAGIYHRKKLKLNPAHPLFQAFTEDSFQFSTRFSFDGGQMGRVIDRERYLRLKARLPKTALFTCFTDAFEGKPTSPFSICGSGGYLSFSEIDEF